MCGYTDRFWLRYRGSWYRDKLEAAEHALENAEAENVRHRKFIAERGLTVQWIQREMAHA